MSKDIKDLDLVFGAKVAELLEECTRYGVTMVPFCTLRTVEEQAKLWRQSRSYNEIHRAINMLLERKADYLAKVLHDVGPQYGRHVTNALPGCSWHQWGIATDAFALHIVGSESTAIWDGAAYQYKIYANVATKLGLTAGYNWHMRDSCHIQAYSSEVIQTYDYEQINEVMFSRYGQKGEVR